MRHLSFIVLLLATSAAWFVLCDNAEDRMDSKWAEHKAKHGLRFSGKEESKRKKHFKAMDDFINQHNSGNSSFTVGHGPHSHLTPEEYDELLLGISIKINIKIEWRDAAPHHHKETTHPTSVDWRTEGAVTPVKDQLLCASCWAFSATGAMEGALFIKHKKLVSLSEQNLLDCSSAQGNRACKGGSMANAFKYVIDNKGIDTEESYPYQGSNQTCAYKAADKGGKIISYRHVPQYSESALEAAVAEQPVSAAIDAGHPSFQSYRSGVYYEPACNSTRVNHGVLVVGYGSLGAGQDYWVVKNSWGTSWGQDGYIFMARNKNNNCGIATLASYPVV